MTKQESFKRSVRARMEKTGERYAAARRSLIDKSGNDDRRWVSHPETSDEAVRQNTGRGWDEWCDLIDAGPGRSAGHSAIAAWLQDEQGVGSWWAQTVTVGYERITGLRLPHQMPDGTFTANKSRTLSVDADTVAALLRDPSEHAYLFPGHPTDLRSRPGTKSVRIGIGDALATITVEPRDQGRSKVTVSHEKLPDSAAVEEWKFYWEEWLEALEEARS